MGVSSEEDVFDLVVIGGGAAGEKGAVQAAYFGKKVALIEREPVLGGAMVNTGTIPSKTLRETALVLSGLRQRGLYGIDLTLPRAATVTDFLHRLSFVTKEEGTRMAANLARHDVTCIHGTARFIDPHTLAVATPGGERIVRAGHVLIATGSSPNRPPAFQFEQERIYDSDEIVNVHEIPKALTIVGGGVIGSEYACLFAALGVKVTMVEAKGSLMQFLDDEILELLMKRMASLGIEFKFNSEVALCTAGDNQVEMILLSGEALKADAVLVCAGRQANTSKLGLEAAGLTAGKRGQLDVDPVTFRTPVPHIAAVGDVIGFPALASTSMEQARVAVVHLFDFKYKIKVAPIFPYGIYTIPEVSMAGETEASLKAKNVPYVVGSASLLNNARGLIIGDEGLLKLLFHQDDMRLLGVHCLGEGATELIHIGLMALMAQGTADVFIQTCFNYPTLSEAYKYASYDALGRKAKSAEPAAVS